MSLYDLAGMVTASVDGNGYTTQYALDAAGRVTLSTDPNGNTMLQAYDADGLVTLTTDGNGNTTQQQFDSSGLLTVVTAARTYPGKCETSEAFDGNSQLRSETSRRNDSGGKVLPTKIPRCF